MNNWKELVGFQKINTKQGKVDYLIFEQAPPVELRFVVHRGPVLCNMNEQQLIECLDQVFSLFPTRVENDTFKIERAKNNVARLSRRGFANTRWKNAMYYKGQQRQDLPASQMDAPVIVAECDGEYGVFVHPKFDDYGFIVE